MRIDWMRVRASVFRALQAAVLLLVLSTPMGLAAAAPIRFTPVFAATSGNFFNDLFGLLGGRPKPESTRMEAPVTVPGYGTTRRRDRKSSVPTSSNSGSGGFGGGTETQAERPRRGSGYRTMCVRLCDGFYWPVSNDASSADFNADKRTCESSCMTPAKLYYQTDKGEDPAQMRSLDGATYKTLDTAFAYRKALQPTCRCKADPWSATEQMRHQSYAANQSLSVQAAPGAIASSLSLDLLAVPAAESGTVHAGEPMALP
jgi:hypothetical protein